MEIIKNLITRFQSTGALFLIGLLLIIYVAVGLLYWQQGAKQAELETQITNLSLIVAKPLAGKEQLEADYEAVNLTLTPITKSDAIAMLVDIARENGIDVDPASNKFNIPSASATAKEGKVGGGTYQILSFTNIRVQGDYDKVMAFISDLDSGKTLETMVLTKVDISRTEITYVAEEAARRAELRDVSSAVTTMMTNNNNLTEIPNPMNYAGGTASNDMTAFPDSTSAATVDKVNDPDGTAYQAGDKEGYLLYSHDITADDAQTGLVNYITTPAMTYYYTCEADGTVRQFDSGDIASAIEYQGSEEAKTEFVATLVVDIYTTTPSEGDQP